MHYIINKLPKISSFLIIFGKRSVQKRKKKVYKLRVSPQHHIYFMDATPIFSNSIIYKKVNGRFKCLNLAF